MALRLLIYDRTCPHPWFLPGLSQIWGAGRHLYRALGRLDASWGATGWGEALDWLATVRPEERIAEIQFWGHGRWGLARIGNEAIDRRAVEPGHVHHERLRRVRDRLVPGAESLWWFRTCETFGTEVGQGFARAWTRILSLPRRGPHLRHRRLAEWLARAATRGGADLVAARRCRAGRGATHPQPRFSAGRTQHHHVFTRTDPRRLLSR